jgi:hypothetical protein
MATELPMSHDDAMTPWVKWLGILTYFGIAVLLTLDGFADKEALAMGVGMLAFGLTWALIGTQRINRAGERAIELVGVGIAGVVMIALWIGVPLAALYFVVRFVKWAWTND